MSASLAAKVEKTADYVRKFDGNTLKSKKQRLGTQEAIERRLEWLDQAWADFVAAWSPWQAAAETDEQEAEDEYTFQFDREYYDEVRDAFDDAFVRLTVLRKEVLGVKPLPVAQRQADEAVGGPSGIGGQGSGTGSAPHLSAGSTGGGSVGAQVAHPPAQAQDIVQPSLRLPTLQPPSFNGELEGWVSFRDVFSAIVVRNQSLSDVHRLHLLRAACVGPAADVIAGIALVEGHFAIAWQALERKYENERLLVFRIIERMLNLPAMTRDCPVELGRLLNGTNHAVRALRVMGRHTDQLGDVLVVLTVIKLDVTTRTAWEREQGAKKVMPTFEQLDEFLHGMLGSLEAMRDWSGRNGGLSEVQNSHNSHQPGRTAHTHVVAASTGGGSPCELCTGQHRLYNCPQFQAISVTDRRTFVAEHRLCFRCISAAHRALMCTSRFACRVCGQNHHTLLHVYWQQSGASVAVADSDSAASGVAASPGVSVVHAAEGAAAEVAEGAAAEAAEVAAGVAAEAASGARRTNPFDVPRASANMCTAASRHNPLETLLPTAWVKVTTADGRSSRLRALIDQGSQVSLMSRQACLQLGMCCEPTDISVTGIAEATGRTYGEVQLDAAAWFGGKAIGICALVMAAITADLPSVNVRKSTHPALTNLQLADPDYWQSGQVDLLLGAAVVAEILRGGVRRADGLTAQETLFGWMVSGCTRVRPQMSATVACTTILHNGLRFVEQEELPYRQGGRRLGESVGGAVPSHFYLPHHADFETETTMKRTVVSCRGLKAHTSWVAVNAVQHFWSRWSRDYMHRRRERAMWQMQSQPREGCCVRVLTHEV